MRVVFSQITADNDARLNFGDTLGELFNGAFQRIVDLLLEPLHGDFESVGFFSDCFRDAVFDQTLGDLLIEIGDLILLLTFEIFDFHDSHPCAL